MSDITRVLPQAAAKAVQTAVKTITEGVNLERGFAATLPGSVLPPEDDLARQAAHALVESALPGDRFVGRGRGVATPALRTVAAGAHAVIAEFITRAGQGALTAATGSMAEIPWADLPSLVTPDAGENPLAQGFAAALSRMGTDSPVEAVSGLAFRLETTTSALAPVEVADLLGAVPVAFGPDGESWHQNLGVLVHTRTAGATIPAGIASAGAHGDLESSLAYRLVQPTVPRPSSEGVPMSPQAIEGLPAGALFVLSGKNLKEAKADAGVDLSKPLGLLAAYLRATGRVDNKDEQVTQLTVVRGEGSRVRARLTAHEAVTDGASLDGDSGLRALLTGALPGGAATWFTRLRRMGVEKLQGALKGFSMLSVAGNERQSASSTTLMDIELDVQRPGDRAVLDRMLRLDVEGSKEEATKHQLATQLEGTDQSSESRSRRLGLGSFTLLNESYGVEATRQSTRGAGVSLDEKRARVTLSREDLGGKLKLAAQTRDIYQNGTNSHELQLSVDLTDRIVTTAELDDLRVLAERLGLALSLPERHADDDALTLWLDRRDNIQLAFDLTLDLTPLDDLVKDAGNSGRAFARALQALGATDLPVDAMADPALRDMGAHYAAARTRRNNGLMRETRMGASGVMNELAHDYFARAGRKIAPDAKVLANAHAFAEAVMDLAADNPRRGDALSRLAQGPQVAANLLGLVELIGPDAVRAQEGALQSA